MYQRLHRLAASVSNARCLPFDWFNLLPPSICSRALESSYLEIDSHYQRIFLKRVWMRLISEVYYSTIPLHKKRFLIQQCTKSVNGGVHLKRSDMRCKNQLICKTSGVENVHLFKICGEERFWWRMISGKIATATSTWDPSKWSEKEALHGF